MELKTSAFLSLLLSISLQKPRLHIAALATVAFISAYPQLLQLNSET